jgi:copper chaperone NosL
VGLALLACSSLQPLPVRTGETCYGCRQIISDTRLAAEMIDSQGHASKFDTVDCLARYIVEHPDEKIDGVFVTDYKTGRMFAATQAHFVRGAVMPGGMKKIYVAFRASDDAAAFAKAQNTTTVDWKGLLDVLKTS